MDIILFRKSTFFLDVFRSLKILFSLIELGAYPLVLSEYLAVGFLGFWSQKLGVPESFFFLRCLGGNKVV